MSFYVRRSGTHTDPFTGQASPRAGWTGPISSETQAGKEAEAWRSIGWTATVEPSTPEIRAEVRAWEKARSHEHRIRGYWPDGAQ